MIEKQLDVAQNPNDVNEVVSLNALLLELLNIKFIHLLQDISILAPKKIDWDLKRDVAKRLERLERRTERAIAQMISWRCFS